MGSDAAEARHGLEDIGPIFAAMTKFGIPSSMIGTSLRQFYASMLGRSSEATGYFQKYGLSFFEGGKYKAMPEILSMLRGAYAGMDEEEAARFSEAVFGIRGKKVKSVITATGPRSIEAVSSEIERMMSLWDRVDKALEGYETQLEAIKGTAKSTMGLLFEPATRGAAKFIEQVNRIPTAIGEAALEHPGIPAATTGATLGLMALAGGATSFFLGRAGYRGMRGLKAIGGWRRLLSGTTLAGGVATGKALESAAGVTPVFVTNFSDMPAGAMAGAGAASMMGAAGAGGMFSKLGFGRAIAGGIGTAALPLAIATAVTLPLTLGLRKLAEIEQKRFAEPGAREAEQKRILEAMRKTELHLFVEDRRVSVRGGLDSPRVVVHRTSGAQGFVY